MTGRVNDQRLQTALGYIDAHLESDLSLATLCDVAGCSKFHFLRQFSATFGVSAYNYVQLGRLKRASYRLAFRTTDPIIDIALEAGFAGPEAFARAFKKRFRQTPSEFRADPDWSTWNSHYESIHRLKDETMKQRFPREQVRIVDFKATQVAVFEHRGTPASIGDSIRRFIAWRKEVGLPPRISATFNILYDDPTDTLPADFRLDICAATKMEILPENEGIVAKAIPSGRCAVLRHVGSDDALRDSVTYLYRDWLPQSDEEPREYPLYCQRVEFFPDVPEREAITDIFLPLK